MIQITPHINADTADIFILEVAKVQERGAKLGEGRKGESFKKFVASGRCVNCDGRRGETVYFLVNRVGGVGGIVRVILFFILTPGVVIFPIIYWVVGAVILHYVLRWCSRAGFGRT